MTALHFYERRVSSLEQQHKKLVRKRMLYSWLRFACIAALVAVFYFLISDWVAIACFSLALLVVFRMLIYRDIANKEAIAHNRELLHINESEIKALAHQYDSFNDGSQHSLHDHYYANDMDIFGPASLFRFVNRTASEMGSAQLANWLLHPAAEEDILQRQLAVKELGKKTEWLQNLQALGRVASVNMLTYNRLQHWLYEPAVFTSPIFKWMRWILPAISISVTAATIFRLLPMNVFYLVMLGMAMIAFRLEKKVQAIHNRLGKMVDELKTLSRSIAWIEKEKFESPLLQRLQAEYKQRYNTASQNIQLLEKILDRLDLRFNIVLAVPLNLLALWNLQQCLELEKWKSTHDVDVNHWFNNLGIFEALGSFGVLHFNNPDWAFPALRKEHFSIEANNMGHPLIKADKRVNNFISIDKNASIMLVTGSNMAGKSTYLRSVGINVVLAMAGAPVCADKFSLSPVQLLSSMRIADNLEESTSTFYAELKKLKTVIDKVNAGERVFILLDEILRGTNSLDRHAGSEALIRQLIKKEAAAIIATHDVALASLENTYPANIQNYHFDVQVSQEELYFDYELKPGVCTSMNASILMKKIGIEM
ncbi:MAG: hypothetical protein EOO06_12725 [Chitinophagaceae bacterium]|nr:MAG: hypothetical protein EOO06_12725 [Chitinophagaceae bacterium]